MREHGVSRREFLKRAAISAGAMAFSRPLASAAETKRNGNPLPRWRGFNLIDFVAPNPNGQWVTNRDDDFKWIVDWGFDFVRLPIAYSRYIDFDRSRNATPADVYKINAREVDKIQTFVQKAQGHGLHVSLNLHRAPGYCINAGFHEPYDLWNSKEAQEAFSFHW